MITDKCNRTNVIVCVICFAFALAIVLLNADWNQAGENSVKLWFEESLEVDVSSWSERDKDEKLYTLSHWGGVGSPKQFRSFVFHQIKGLHLSRNSTFLFLEVGVGVGAFARVVLQMFPNSHGVGFDMVSDAVAIAANVLPTDRMVVMEGNMNFVLKQFPSGYFDNVFVPGSICYLQTMQQVSLVLKELSRIVKRCGGICLSMITDDSTKTGSCRTVISKSFFTSICPTKFELEVVQMDEMDNWNTGDQFGRYSVCLKKRCESKGITNI